MNISLIANCFQWIERQYCVNFVFSPRCSWLMISLNCGPSGRQKNLMSTPEPNMSGCVQAYIVKSVGSLDRRAPTHLHVNWQTSEAELAKRQSSWLPKFIVRGLHKNWRRATGKPVSLGLHIPGCLWTYIGRRWVFWGNRCFSYPQTNDSPNFNAPGEKIFLAQ